MKRLVLLWLGIALLLAGVAGASLYLWQNAGAPVTFQPVKAVQPANLPPTQQTQTTQPLSGKPVRLVVPRLGIDIKIVDGYYNASAKDWTVSPTAANYAVNTPRTNNERGKTFIYGHDIPSVLAPTEHIALGDIAYVYTDNGHQFEYKYTGDTIVTPTNTSLFDQLDGAPGLVLMTCDGLWSQNRRIMNFDLVSAS